MCVLSAFKAFSRQSLMERLDNDCVDHARCSQLLIQEFLQNTQTGKTFACTFSYDRQKYVRHAGSSASSAKTYQTIPVYTEIHEPGYNSLKASFTEVNIYSK